MQSVAPAMGRSGVRGWWPGARHWVVERRLVLAAGMAAALPIAVAAVNAVVVGWLPLGDNAYTAVRAFDVFTERSPLVGQWSSGASSAADELTYSPGPLLFWLLAVPARFLEPSSLAVTIGLVNVASIMGAVGLAYRRGGLGLMVATAIAIPVMLASLPAETYSTTWNSSAALFPFLLLIFLAWSLACGEYRLLPLTVLVASYAAQTHLTFVAPTAALMAVALAGLASARSSARPWGSMRRWALAAALVGLLCWSAPLIEQATEEPGNLTLLAEAASTDEPTLGRAAAWRAVVHTVGIPPWWLRDARDPLQRVADLSESPSALAVASTLILLCGLAVVMLVGWRSRQPALWAGGACGLVLCAAVGANAGSTPQEAVGSVDYTLRLASPVGLYVWLVLGWSLATLGPVRRLAASRGLSLALARRPARAALVGVVVAAAAGAVVAVAANTPLEPYRQMRIIADRLESELPRGRVTRIEPSFSQETFLMAASLQAGAVYALRRAGWDVTAPSLVDVGLGRDYEREAHEQLVRLDVDRPPSGGGRVIARLEARQPYSPDTSEKAINVSLEPTR